MPTQGSWRPVGKVWPALGQVLGQAEAAAGVADVGLRVQVEEVGGLVPVVQFAVEAMGKRDVALAVALGDVADHPPYGLHQVFGAARA